MNAGRNYIVGISVKCHISDSSIQAWIYKLSLHFLMTDTPQGRAFGAAAEEKYRKRSYMRRQESDDSDLSTPVGPAPLSTLEAPPSMGEKRKIGMIVYS